jgi:hypothetical protein
MTRNHRAIAISTLVAAAFLFAVARPITAQEENPAKEKFQQDLKSAVLNGSITGPQLKEIQQNLEVLKAAKSATPGGPVDLMTPYTAISKIRGIMATVKEPDQTTLRQDFKLMMATRQPAPSTEPETPGKKLGKDIFSAVMKGEPTPDQVQSLQQSLNSLESLKGSSDGGLKKLRTLKEAKSQISQTVNSPNFRPEDTQTVLADLNNLGPQGRGGV